MSARISLRNSAGFALFLILFQSRNSIGLMARWAPDEAPRHTILVDNPARLYEFAEV